MTGWEGVTIELRIESPSLSWRSLAAEEPFEGGSDRASDQRANQHAPPKVFPGGVPPDEAHYSARQPERAVAAVSGDERQQAQEARLAWDGEARRYLAIEGNELLYRHHHLLGISCACLQFGADDLQLERFVHVHPYLGVGERDGATA